MASITPRNGKFLVRVRRDGFATVTRTFTRRADGAAWARQVEADMEAGRWIEPAQQVPTLTQAINEYRATVGAKMKGAQVYAYRFDELASSQFAAKRVDDITPIDLTAWRDAQAVGRKPSTVARKLAILSAILTWCMKERGWLKANPMTSVTKPRVSDARDRVLAGRERAYLLAACDTSRAAWLRDVLTLLMSSAMRRSELFGLRIEDIDPVSAVAHLHDTKNGCPRAVPLCPTSLEALDNLTRAAKARGDSRLVPVGAVGSISTRFKITVRRARTAYEADCVKAEEVTDPRFLSDLRLHDLRHTAATMWAATGKLSVFELQAVTGHKTPAMLSRYVNLKPTDIARKLATVAQSVD
jgi:integrase